MFDHTSLLLDGVLLKPDATTSDGKTPGARDDPRVRKPPPGTRCFWREDAREATMTAAYVSRVRGPSPVFFSFSH